MTGSVRKVGENLRITVQLIDIKSSNCLWSQPYDGKYTSEVFDFQNTIAKKVAESLDVILSQKDRETINAKPTKNMLAHDLCLKGSDVFWGKWWGSRDSQYLKIAANCFNEALRIDPDYVDAKAGKGFIYTQAGKYDSARVYFDEILKIDRENNGALIGLAYIFLDNNKPDSAIKIYRKILDISPNLFDANYELGQCLLFYQNNVIEGLPFYQKAYDLGGSSQASVLLNIGLACFYLGEYPKALKYIKKTLSMESSWCWMVRNSYNILYIQGNYNEALNFLDSIQNFTTCGNVCDLMRFYYYTSKRDFKKAEIYLDKAKAFDDSYWKRELENDVYVNYLLKETGRENEALKGLKNSIKYYEADMLKKGSLSMPIIRAIDRLKLAASYAMLGENKKALKYLSLLEKFGLFEYPITLSFPGFDNLRSDPEFKAIVKRIEDQRAATRAKVREMEQNGELHL